MRAAAERVSRHCGAAHAGCVRFGPGAVGIVDESGGRAVG